MASPSLAQRRLKGQLGVITNPEFTTGGKSRHIDQISDNGFALLYTLSETMLPSNHKGVEIRYARRNRDNKEVVVKMRLKPKCFSDSEQERNWRCNTEFMLNMPSCRQIVRMLEVLEDTKAIYVIMEKAQGVDLRELLCKECVNIPPQACRQILQNLLEAVQHLHDNSAVHKDLKLENIMVDSNSCERYNPKTVKIIDFDTVEEWSPQTPAAKDVLGTDRYIAQEAYAGRYSPFSDIFALGVIAYRMLTGSFPFHSELFDDKPGENWVGSRAMQRIQYRLKTAKINWKWEVFRDDPLACDLVQRMLSVKANDRPTAAEALSHPWFTGVMPSTSLSCSGQRPTMRDRSPRPELCKGEGVARSSGLAGPPRTENIASPRLKPLSRDSARDKQPSNRAKTTPQSDPYCDTSPRPLSRDCARDKQPHNRARPTRQSDPYCDDSPKLLSRDRGKDKQAYNHNGAKPPLALGLHHDGSPCNLREAPNQSRDSLPPGSSQDPCSSSPPPSSQRISSLSGLSPGKVTRVRELHAATAGSVGWQLPPTSLPTRFDGGSTRPVMQNGTQGDVVPSQDVAKGSCKAGTAAGPRYRSYIDGLEASRPRTGSSASSKGSKGPVEADAPRAVASGLLEQLSSPERLPPVAGAEGSPQMTSNLPPKFPLPPDRSKMAAPKQCSSRQPR